jgi:hypothetical protein
MALTTDYPIRPAGGGNTVIPTKKGLEAAGSGFRRGELLIWSSGKLARFMSPHASNNFANGALIVGIAAQDATGVADSEIAYYPLDSVEVCYPIVGAVSALSQVRTSAFDISLRIISSVNYVVVDVSDTTGGCAVIQDFHPEEAIGATNHRGWVRFTAAQRATPAV